MLDDRLRGLIQSNGPMPLSEFMRLALLDPEDGYYVTQPAIGSAGDFTTAPETSQMFGELLGLWLADQWQQQGAAENALLCEVGPGRGTLMADALRVLAQVTPGFPKQVHLVEASPLRQQDAAKRLPGGQWHTTLDDVPTGPLFLIANEFFDALPIRQFVRRTESWGEICVGLENGQLALVERTIPTPPDVDAAPGQIVEVSADGEHMAAQIGQRVAQQGGAALIADYGYDGKAGGAQGDTLQALYNGQPSPVLAHPGKSDLSAHVNFAALQKSAEAAGAKCFGPALQGPFLEALGLRHRANQLRADADVKRRAQIEAAVMRLTSPAQMGALFKVLAIVPKEAQTPAGFIS